MSKASLAKLEDAIREHLAAGYAEAECDPIMTDWVVGIASMHHEGDVPVFHVNHAMSPMSSPHGSIGLFAMAAEQHAEAMRPGDDDDDDDD